MSRSVTIPSYMTPYWRCNINNKEYAYLAGTTQTVPDEVAALIDQYNAAQPKEGPRSKIPSEELPIASRSSLGAMKIGSNLSIEEDGTLSSVVPIMTPTVKGGAKLGAGLDVTDGVLSVANRVIGFYRSDPVTESQSALGSVEFTGIPNDVTVDNAICLVSCNSSSQQVVQSTGWKIDTTNHKLVCGYRTTVANVTFTLCAVLIYAPKPAEAVG